LKPESSHRTRTIAICVLLFLATAVAYEPLRQNEFVDLDDDAYITKNQHVRAGLSRDSVTWAFTARAASNWHPLTWLSHMLDVELYDMDPAGHHRTGWLLHVAATLLLFLVFQRMTRAVWPSAFVAAVFALHPLHVESVAWAAERKDVLSGLFFMLTLGAYARYTERPGPGRYAWVFLALFLGLMAKPMLVTLPFVLLLLDFWPLERWGQNGARRGAARLVLEKLPLFALVGLSSVVTFLVQRAGGAVENVPFAVRLANAVVAYVVYVQRTLWPASLAVMYPFPADGVGWWPALGALSLLIVATAAVFRFGRRLRYLPVGWLWYLGTLVPVIGVVQVGYQASADRYTYIPLIGLSILVAWGAADLAQRLRAGRSWIVVPVALVLVALVFTTRAQVGRWRDTATLYGHAVRVTRGNYVILTNLGVEQSRQGNFVQAIDYLQRALEARPDFDHAHYNLGAILHRQGRLDEAVEHYRRALEATPGYVNAHLVLGPIAHRQGNLAQAIEHYRPALAARPENLELRFRLATALHGVGALDEAMGLYREVLQVNPENAVAHENLARALAAQGLLEQAAEHRAEALRLQAP
jgi:tetratricopeptide (TPR) repeat protein